MHSDAQTCPQTCPASVPFDNPVSSAFSEGAERNSWLGPVPPPAGRDTERHTRHPERLFPAQPSHPVDPSYRSRAGLLHLTYPSTASWMECDHRWPIHRPEAIRRPARIVAPFFDQFFRTLSSRQLEIARTRRRLPPQQHLPEDTGHARVTSEFADVGRCPARIPRIEMFPASVDKLFLHRFSLQ